MCIFPADLHTKNHDHLFSIQLRHTNNFFMHNDIRYGPITINVIIIKAIKMLLLLHYYNWKFGRFNSRDKKS